MSDVTYSGKVDFGDWDPIVRNAKDMASQIQGTFLHNRDVGMQFTEDGLAVEIIFDCLGDGYTPTFTHSLSDMAQWVIDWHEPEYDHIAGPLVHELRRIADKIEAETRGKSQ